MIVLNEASKEPLYLQIYNQIKKEIISGEIVEGSKLPSTRNLSKILNVSRNTVESAFLQLSSEGYVVSKAGSGFVVQKIDGSFFTEQNKNANFNTTKNIVKQEISKMEDQYKFNFRYGRPSVEDFPMTIWRKLSNKYLSTTNIEKILSYNERKGELELRTEIMKYLSRARGVKCGIEQIVICAGMQQCLSLVCQLLKNRYNKIGFEEPGYSGARDVFINNGCEVLPISLEEGVINLEQLEKSDAQLVYVTPSHQFPTGSVMTIQKRVRLLEWAEKNGGIIIEDDYDSELRYNSRPIPSIQSIDAGGRVIYIGTFSKSLAPGFRVSYMVLPEQWVRTYDEKFKRYNSPVPWLQQKVLSEFMSQGYWESHLRKLCNSYKRKHDVLISSIYEVMGDRVRILGMNAGLHIILEFNCGLKEGELLKRAENHGIKIYPVSQFWMNEERYTDNMILLGFSGMSEDDIREGVIILNNAWFDNYITN